MPSCFKLVRNGPGAITFCLINFPIILQPHNLSCRLIVRPGLSDQIAATDIAPIGRGFIFLYITWMVADIFSNFYILTRHIVAPPQGSFLSDLKSLTQYYSVIVVNNQLALILMGSL